MNQKKSKPKNQQNKSHNKLIISEKDCLKEFYRKIS